VCALCILAVYPSWLADLLGRVWRSSGSVLECLDCVRNTRISLLYKYKYCFMKHEYTNYRNMSSSLSDHFVVSWSPGLLIPASCPLPFQRLNLRVPLTHPLRLSHLVTRRFSLQLLLDLIPVRAERLGQVVRV
jgi:hypothetical protein